MIRIDLGTILILESVGEQLGEQSRAIHCAQRNFGLEMESL